MVVRWCRVLVWLVALALPLQGLAAAARLHCAAAAGLGAHGQHSLPAQHAHHGQPADLVLDRGDGVHAHAGAAVPAADEDAGATPGSAAAQKCSACAACNVGAAPPPARAVLPSAGPGARVVVATPLPALSFIATGPERPPRSLPT